jgi:hypothetical protein
LADINGDKQDLAKRLGERGTILLFWSPDSRASVEEFRELAIKVASPLHVAGIRVVSVCKRATAEMAKGIAGQAGASFTVLLDEDGAALSHVATSMLPRTYLLDQSGKILWFDIEYSHAMWRDLREALRAIVTQKASATH